MSQVVKPLNEFPECWIIYYNTPGYEKLYLARLFLNGKPTETCITNESLGYIRVVLAHNYPQLQYYPRYMTDPGYLVETWM